MYILKKKDYLKFREKHGNTYWYGLAPKGKYTARLAPEFTKEQLTKFESYLNKNYERKNV